MVAFSHANLVGRLGFGVLLLSPMVATPRAAPSPAAPAQSAAQQSRDLARQRLNEGQQHLKEGQQHLKEGRPSDALESFNKSYAAVPTPLTKWDIADACDRLHLVIEGLAAIDDYLAYLAGTNDADLPPRRRRLDAERLRNRLEAQLAYLHIVAPDGAEVRVDGHSHGEAPLDGLLRVNPTTHLVEAFPPGGKLHWSRRVSLRAGEQQEVDLRTPLAQMPRVRRQPVLAPPLLSPAPPPPLPPPSLSDLLDPWAPRRKHE